VTGPLHRWITCVLLPVLLAHGTAARAQVPDSTAFRRHALKAWEVGAVVAGGLVTMAVLDAPIHEWSQDSTHRSGTLDDLSSVVREFGQVDVIAPVTGGIILAGLITNKPSILHSGLRIGASVLLSSAVTQVAKYSLGRKRPDATDGVWDFAPFSGSTAMWSGHSSAAFAFATSLSQEIHNPWATAGLFVFATGTAWSRVYDNKHWASDVLVGAAVGIASAKLATGRWTIFGLRVPAPLAGNGRAGLMWQGSF
jgi:membrane-associated phospholipid phosphatase